MTPREKEILFKAYNSGLKIAKTLINVELNGMADDKERKMLFYLNEELAKEMVYTDNQWPLCDDEYCRFPLGHEFDGQIQHECFFRPLDSPPEK